MQKIEELISGITKTILVIILSICAFSVRAATIKEEATAQQKVTLYIKIENLRNNDGYVALDFLDEDNNSLLQFEGEINNQE